MKLYLRFLLFQLHILQRFFHQNEYYLWSGSGSAVQFVNPVNYLYKKLKKYDLYVDIYMEEDNPFTSGDMWEISVPSC